MLLSRRGFIGSILALGAAPAIARIGSLMPVRSIVIPTTAEVIAVGGGNTLLTIDMITREALRVLHQNVSFVRGLNKSFEEEFSRGDTIQIRRPVQYASR